MTGHRTRWTALLIGVAVAALGVIFALQVDSDPSATKNQSRLVGTRVPELDLPNLAGGRIQLADFVGKTVVINFWNTWCVPCRQEHEALVAFHAQHRGAGDVVLVGIVRDDTESAVRSYVRDNNVGWLVALDPGDRASVAFATRGQPETYVVGPDGVIVAVRFGPSTTRELNELVARAAGRL